MSILNSVTDFKAPLPVSQRSTAMDDKRRAKIHKAVRNQFNCYGEPINNFGLADDKMKILYQDGVFENMDDGDILVEMVAKVLKNNTELRRKRRKLTFENCSISSEGIKALAGLNSITALNLRVNHINDEGALIFAQMPLQALDLADNCLTKKGIAVLAKIPSLTRLILGNKWGIGWENIVGDKSVTRLAENHGLTELSLKNTRIGSRGATTLANSQGSLTSLNLGGCRIKDQGAKALAQNGNLRELDLTDVRTIRIEGIKALLLSGRLTRLNLTGIVIDVKGAEVIAKNNTLLDLTLQFCHLGDGAVSLIARHPILERLDLRDNFVGKKGAAALAQSQSIRELDLGYNKTIKKYFLEAFDTKTISQLELDYKGIGDEGARALVQSPTLTRLGLAKDGIRDKGAIVLASHPRLTFLDLSRNKVSDKAVKSLAANPRLLTLLLSNNNHITCAGWKIFLTNFNLTSMGDRIGENLKARMIGNRCLARNWQRIAVLLASCRANSESLISDSILDITSSITVFLDFDEEGSDITGCPY